MIVILYDDECDIIQSIALKIRHGIQINNMSAYLMPLSTLDKTILNSAKCIIFGCRTGIMGTGVSETMLKFMNQSLDIFENQTWKNKMASGFTTDSGSASEFTILDFCKFAAKHSMIWISQGHLAENEGQHISIERVNCNKSFLGCITGSNPMDLTGELFGRRISYQVNRIRNVSRQ
jgi:flavodoxin